MLPNPFSPSSNKNKAESDSKCLVSWKVESSDESPLVVFEKNRDPVAIERDLFNYIDELAHETKENKGVVDNSISEGSCILVENEIKGFSTAKDEFSSSTPVSRRTICKNSKPNFKSFRIGTTPRNDNNLLNSDPQKELAQLYNIICLKNPDKNQEDIRKEFHDNMFDDELTDALTQSFLLQEFPCDIPDSIPVFPQSKVESDSLFEWSDDIIMIDSEGDKLLVDELANEDLEINPDDDDENILEAFALESHNQVETLKTATLGQPEILFDDDDDLDPFMLEDIHDSTIHSDAVLSTTIKKTESSSVTSIVQPAQSLKDLIEMKRQAAISRLKRKNSGNGILN